MNREECVVKNLLESWISRNNTCFVESYNFITQESLNKYKISINEKAYDGNLFVGVYEIFVSDNEFRIIGIN